MVRTGPKQQIQMEPEGNLSDANSTIFETDPQERTLSQMKSWILSFLWNFLLILMLRLVAILKAWLKLDLSQASLQQMICLILQTESRISIISLLKDDASILWFYRH